MDEDGGEQAQRSHPTSSETLISEPHPDPPSTCPDTSFDRGEDDRTDSKPPPNQAEIFRAVAVVERESLAIAESFTSLLDSLRMALSEVTSNSVDHMHCFSDAASRLQESVLDAATKGNRYINACLSVAHIVVITGYNNTFSRKFLPFLKHICQCHALIDDCLNNIESLSQ